MKLVRLLMDGVTPSGWCTPSNCRARISGFVDTEGAGSMGSLKDRLSKFAKSSKGKKLRDTAMRKAKDPKMRAKIANKFRKKG
jgi:hypothetical protein